MPRAKKWIVTDIRFVIFLDILGFRDLVMRETHESILELLYNIRKQNGYIFEKNKYITDDVYVVTFSDSIILFSRKDTYHDFTQAFTIAANLMSRMIAMGVPVKGAVAHGKISVDKENQLFLDSQLSTVTYLVKTYLI